MGCGASTVTSKAVSAVGPYVQSSTISKEVSAWFNTLNQDMRKYRPVLLPEEGCFVAQWTKEYLISKGLDPHDAQRLLVYRDKAVAKAAATAPGSGVGGQAADSGVVSLESAAAASTPQQPEPTRQAAAKTMTAMPQHPPEGRMSTGGQQDNDPDQAQKDSLLDLLGKGMRWTKVAIEKLGPSLPFPGAEAASLLVSLLDLVDTAIANHSNLRDLQQRAVALLDILAAYHPELVRLRQYKGAVDDFVDLLQGIISYARSYRERSCLMRLLTGGSDAEHYNELVARAEELCERVMLLLAADSNARLQAVQREAEQAVRLLKQAARYQDPSAGARVLVDQLGGLDAVLADGDKLRRVMQQLDVSTRVTIEVMSSLLSSHLDKGPQRHIRHHDLRLFWNRQYADVSEVPWYVFWQDFPALLKDNPADVAMVEELSRLLADEAARVAFERAVERNNGLPVSVWELRAAFGGDDGLPQQVSRLLPGPDAVPASVDAGSEQLRKQEHGGAALDGSSAPQPGPTTADGTSPSAAAAGGARCQLPPLPQNYLGRAADAGAVAEHLLTRGSLLLLAPGGLGKSSLAIDVGWHLVRRVHHLAAALWVDLREAGSVAEVEARFCAALGLQPEKTDAAIHIVAAVKQVAKGAATSPGEQRAGGLTGFPVPPVAALLVIDNAEDAVLKPEAAEAVRGLLSRVLLEVPAVRLLVTSRVPITGQQPPVSPALEGACSTPLHELLPHHPVGAINQTEAARLVRTVVADLTEEEAEEVAAACGCVPLVLCLVAEALVAGRLVPEDLTRLSTLIGPGPTNSDPTLHTIRLVLGGMRRQHQLAAAQLTVFPSTFDTDGAAAVLGLTKPQAHSVLAALYRYSLVQRGGTTQQYIMHMVLRQLATQLGQQLDASLVAHAEGRFVTYLVGLLREWAAMYRVAKEWKLALAMARQHQPDLGKLLELLAAGAPKGKDGGAERAAITGSAPHSFWDPSAVAAALDDDVRILLEALALLPRWEVPCMALMTRLQCSAAGAGAQHPVDSKSTSDTQLQTPRLLLMLAWIKFRGGRCKEAEQDARQCLKLCSAALGPEHVANASALNALASCLYSADDFANAEPLYRRALELRVRGLGEEHPATAFSYNNLAACLGELDKNEEAEPLYDKAMALRLQLLGEDHPETAQSLHNLANCKVARGRHSEAEALYRRALLLQQRVLGDEHHSTAFYLFNLAQCVVEQGRRAEAEQLYRQAWKLWDRVLGETHRSTIRALHNLAICVHAQGRHSDAESLYRQVMEQQERVLGEDHPDSQRSLCALALCLNSDGRLSEAEPLYQRLAASQERTLGEDHQASAKALYSLADCVSGQGRYSDAEPFYRQALEVQRRALGEGHPDTVASVGGLAKCLRRQGRGDDLETLYRETLVQRRSTLGEEHSSTVAVLSQLARCLGDKGADADAEQLYRQAYDLKRRVLGEEHLRTIAALSDLAECIDAQERYGDAEPLYETIVRVRRRELGEEHPETAEALHNLASCVYSLERYPEAEALYRQAVRVALHTLGREDTLVQMYLDNLGSCVEAQGRPYDADVEIEVLLQERG